jgi:hypothetical protein
MVLEVRKLWPGRSCPRSILARAAVRETAVTNGSPDYRALLGEAAWRRLPANVRERFARHHAQYRGETTVRASAVGCLLAQLCRLIGTPLPCRQGRRVAATVTVTPDAATGGSRWRRCYRFPGRPPLVIESVKAIDVDGQLVERLAVGLRMKLRTYEREGALHFESVHYFFECCGFRWHLPRWLSPGRMRVEHRDRARGWFRFVLSIEHPWLGLLFYQDGIFRGET